MRATRLWAAEEVGGDLPEGTWDGGATEHLVGSSSYSVRSWSEASGQQPSRGTHLTEGGETVPSFPAWAWVKTTKKRSHHLHS
ncbi:rCG21927, partial [Rattus norvegicus]